jgi:hypothetical protein
MGKRLITIPLRFVNKDARTRKGAFAGHKTSLAADPATDYSSPGFYQ